MSTVKRATESQELLTMFFTWLHIFLLILPFRQTLKLDDILTALSILTLAARHFYIATITALANSDPASKATSAPKAIKIKPTLLLKRLKNDQENSIFVLLECH